MPKCRSTRETLGHIIGKCRHTKDKRIIQHDKIKDFVKACLAIKHQVIDEPEVRVNGHGFKPDLVVKTTKGEVLMLDVSVRYEHRDYLSATHDEKTTKYKPVLIQLQQDFHLNKDEVLLIIVGFRGAISKRTRDILSKLCFGKKDRLTISVMALRSSIEMINAFMDDDFD